MRLIVLSLIAICCLYGCPILCSAADVTTAPPSTTASPSTPPPSVTSPAPPALSQTATTPAEAKLGEETQKQIEKDVKLVKDEASIARLNRIANEIAPLTQRPDVVYHCKILDTNDVNAMSIPGGTIYVTKGLINAVESDDELAGVLAHEIAHNSLRHVMTQNKRETKANIAEVLALLTSIYASRQSVECSPGDLVMMSEMVKAAVMNGYSVDLELQADQNGVDYLCHLRKYNPIGLYSVLVGFRQMEQHEAPGCWNCAVDHPFAQERIDALEKQFKSLGIQINLWSVENFRAHMIPPADGKQGYQVKLGDVSVITFTAADGDKDARTRATAVTEAINARLMQEYIRQYDVRATIANQQAIITLHGLPVMTLTMADATAANKSLETLSELVQQNIKQAIWLEALKRS